MCNPSSHLSPSLWRHCLFKNAFKVFTKIKIKKNWSDAISVCRHSHGQAKSTPEYIIFESKRSVLSLGFHNTGFSCWPYVAHFQSHSAVDIEAQYRVLDNVPCCQDGAHCILYDSTAFDTWRLYLVVISDPFCTEPLSSMLFLFFLFFFMWLTVNGTLK